jgi:hypothetical protein
MLQCSPNKTSQLKCNQLTSLIIEFHSVIKISTLKETTIQTTKYYKHIFRCETHSKTFHQQKDQVNLQTPYEKPLLTKD